MTDRKSGSAGMPTIRGRIAGRHRTVRRWLAVGTASLAQIYRVALRDGSPGVVKLQRPDVAAGGAHLGRREVVPEPGSPVQTVHEVPVPLGHHRAAQLAGRGELPALL